jgi:hypothetical protein
MMTKKRPAARKERRRQTTKRAATPARRGGLSAMTRRSASTAERVAAVADLPESTANDAQLAALMALLADKSAPTDVRLAALESLGTAAFASPAFRSVRGEYIATLRKVADDPDQELRQRVLGILMREKDGYAQKRLVEGLKQPAKALLPPEKALQLLSYDVHADAYPIARQIVANPPNPLAKREALRLLAADAASAPTFERILRDKNEAPEIRRLVASALHTLKPDSLQAHAREILMDPAEHDELQDVSLTALTQFGRAQIAEDKTLMTRVDELGAKGSETLQHSARKFRAKYQR